MQKKLAIQLAAVAVAGVLSQGAFAADGTINFTGEITSSPCSITAGNQNVAVPLGKVSATTFDGATAGTATAGKAAPLNAFNINLTGCSAAATGGTVTFNGTADTDDTTLVRVTGGAAGVALQITDDGGTKISNGTASKSYTLKQGDNTFKFQAGYVATKTTVTAGVANAVAQFTLALK